jgi:hypothetical protein
MAIRPHLKKASVRGYVVFSFCIKDEIKRVAYRAKMSSCTVQNPNPNVNGAHVTPVSQVSAGANYNVRHWGCLLCLKLHNEFCKISQPVQMLRWLDTPTDSMVIPENVYVA